MFSNPPYPTISVSIDDGGVVPVVGSVYSLSCSVSGAERLLDAAVAYHWLKDGSMVLNWTTDIISFNFLTFSDAGCYACQITISSTFISDPIAILNVDPLSIELICTLLG